MTKPFLGVTRSFTGRSWIDRLDDEARARALAIVQEHGIPDIVARILAARGVEPSETPRFLDPKLRDLMPDPSSLIGMDQAAARLADAIMKGDRIGIFGDYDVDGACSSALLADFLTDCSVPSLVHIPDRLTEGYGPNNEAIRALADKGIRLLVTVDCGTTSHEPIEEARRLGLDTLVLDHHQAPEHLPDAYALVNPNRLDDLSGLGYLCAAGVVFMTLVATNRELRRRGFWTNKTEPDLMASLDLVALATIADVVPLKGLNRAFVRQGLAMMRMRSRVGLRALADLARLDGPLTPYHLGFMIGPRINAGGRIGDAALGARLLSTQDEIEAAQLAETLDRLNRERQTAEAMMVEQAEAQIMARSGIGAEPDDKVLVASSEDWHPGIVGLVASRLKERFRRPVFALARNAEGQWVGSGRSVPGADLGRAVRAAVEKGLAVKGGGHAMAAGVTLLPDHVDAFRDSLEQALQAQINEALADDGLAIDAAVTARGANPDLLNAIEKAGPFGSAHPDPLFVLPSHQVIDAQTVGQNHLRLKLRAGDGATIGGIAFRAADQELGQKLKEARGGLPIHIAGQLTLDRWGGGERVQIRVIDAASAERRF
jgi:single-stranded-DNA-specific exonuclease